MRTYIYKYEDTFFFFWGGGACKVEEGLSDVPPRNSAVTAVRLGICFFQQTYPKLRVCCAREGEPLQKSFGNRFEK
jgi:hypothetical protein